MSTYSELQIVTVNETYLLELCHEVFRQMAFKNANVLDLNEYPTTYITRRKMKNLLPSLYKGTKRKQKSLKNELLVVYNWLKRLNLLLDNIDTLTKTELKSKIKRISQLYFVHKKNLIEMFH